jgi:hypothetical protein
VLAKAIKKELGVKGAPIQGPLRPGAKRKAAPSAPGEPPRGRRAARGSRSAREVVGGVMRVGTRFFTLRILQDGTTHATRGAASTRRASGATRSKTLKRPSVTIAPRPFMEKALEARCRTWKASSSARSEATRAT